MLPVFELAVRKPDGTSVTNIRTYNDATRIVLPPHGAISESLVMDQWFYFDQEGDYEVDINLLSTFKFATGIELRPITHAIQRVHVRPRDVYTLLEHARALTRAVRASDDANQRSDAARTLGYFLDPSIVPYFLALLDETHDLDGVVFGALRRMGNGDARAIAHDALETQAASSDGPRAELARNALLHFGLKEFAILD
jgi:hypothetical protein